MATTEQYAQAVMDLWHLFHNSSLTSEEMRYASRFVFSRGDIAPEAAAQAFLKDKADREEADRTAQHRRRKVLNDAIAEFGEAAVRDAIAYPQGVQATGEVGNWEK